MSFKKVDGDIENGNRKRCIKNYFADGASSS